MIRKTSFKQWMLDLHCTLRSITLFRFASISVIRSKRRARVLAFESLELRELFAIDLRIVTYNVTGGSGTPSSNIGTILAGIGAEATYSAARPIDVLAIQEVKTQATTTANVVAQLNAIYGAGTYARGNLNGTSTGGSDTVGLIYNTQTVQLLGEVGVGTPSSSGQPRQTIRYELQPIGIPAGNEFYVYNSHYKASATTDDKNRRQVEALAIRANADSLPQGTSIIYAGDYNVQSSSEQSFQTLLGAGNGQARDPLNRLGNWNNNSSFRDIDTQAPAVDPPGGLVGGGLDDRFDFQMVSYEWFDGLGLDYLANSYHTFANNGSVALNQSINSPTNTAIPNLPNRTTILDLLTTASDHLPVVADYFFNNTSNSAPTDLGISPSAVVENTASGSLVGTFSTVDADFGDTFTYTLVSGAGSTNNAMFTITGNQLRTNQVFNYEAQNSYNIRVRTTDAAGATFEKALAIGVIDVNEAPTDITLSNQSIAENLSPNTVVGLLGAVDPDALNTFTYQLVDGDGSSDNPNFTIDANQLKASTTFDYESKSSYAIRVRATDQGGLSFDKTFTVNVTDANDAPTAVIFAPTSANQFQSFQSQGFADDQDVGQTHQFEWDFNYDGITFDVDATGDSPFFTYNTAGNYVIALLVRDNGSPALSDVETANITVNAQVNTAPTISSIANQSVAGNTATGTLAFTVGDAETAPAALTVTATSSNTTLVPVANIALGGSGASRTVNVTPANGQSGVSTITLTVSDGALTTSTTFIVTVAAIVPPIVETIVFGDGTTQRSMVKSITVTFDKAVTIDAGAFLLQTRVGTTATTPTAAQLAINVSTALVSGKTVATLTFSGSLIIGNSLSDGNWKLTIASNKVHAGGVDLDGDGVGGAGGDYVKGAVAADAFFRLFGDFDGNRAVTPTDVARFRLANGTTSASPNYRAAFDFDSNNNVSPTDLARFRLRNGTSVPG